MSEKAEENQWHLDKRVPIATIGAIVFQAAAFGWMAASMDSRISTLEAYTAELRNSRLRERLAVEEAASLNTITKFEHLDGQLDRLEDKIDKIVDRVGAK